MGALFTVDPSHESAGVDLPWIVTIGPLGDADDWEPVLCGPYEKPHALALARAVVRGDDLMAVVEPVRTYVSVDQIRDHVTTARAAASGGAQRLDLIFGETPEAAMAAAFADREVSASPPPPDQSAEGPEDLPDPQAVREGLTRIAQRLADAA